MKPATAGYSGTPLAAKLGIKAGTRVCAIEAPVGLTEWLARLPAGVVFQRKPGADTDIAHLFATRQSDLGRELSGFRNSLRSDAVLWVSWPKKASRVDTDISEDRIRELALPLGFVDVKVCAVNAVWSGLKLVVRKTLR
jgi:hypothetical protein